jgi:hypothetical protein
VFLSAPVATLPPIKVKGMFIDGGNGAPGAPPVSPDPSPAFSTGWADLWWYSAPFSFNAQIDLAASIGCNTIRVNGPVEAWIKGGANLTAIQTRMGNLFDYCAGKGLWVYLLLGLADDWSGTLGQVTAALAAEAAFANGYRNVIALDVLQEINLQSQNNQGTALTRMQAFTSQIRAVTNKPLTYSLSVTGSAGWGDSWVDLCAPYVDYQDFHPYYGGFQTPTGGGAIPATDVNAYRATAAYRPFLVGESGIGQSAGGTAVTKRYTDIGTISSATDCYGACGWLTVDYESTFKFGAYDINYVNPRSNLTTPFAAWPSGTFTPH